MRRCSILAARVLCLLVVGSVPARAGTAQDLDGAISSIATQITAAWPGSTQPPPRIAVVSLAPAGEGAAATRFGRLAADLLATQLIRMAHGSYQVIEREHVIKLIDDAELTDSDPTVGVKLTKALHATALATGTFTPLTGRILISVRVLDTATLTALAAATASVTRSPDVDALLGPIPTDEATAAPERPPGSFGPPDSIHVVTNADYEEFIRAHGYREKDLWNPDGWAWRTRSDIHGPAFRSSPALNLPSKPVVGVSWYEASAYAKWAGGSKLIAESPAPTFCAGGASPGLHDVSLWTSRHNLDYPDALDVTRNCEPSGYLPPTTRREDLGFATTRPTVPKEQR